MIHVQSAFDFEVDRVQRYPTSAMLKAEATAQREDDLARARRKQSLDEARAYWSVGMVTSLPVFATVLDSEQRYTQMLPGVVESITGDTATVRIYAAPEYGYTIENYPLHGKLAIDVPLVDLGVHHGEQELERLVREGRLATGAPELAAEVRSRTKVKEKG